MKTLFNLIAFITLISSIEAQTFNGTTGDITSNSCGSENVFTNEVSGVGILGETNDFTEIVLNITHSYDPDLDIYLIAPDGTSIELTTDNGDGWFGNNDNYTDTHFRPDASTNIVDGEAPFTGNFLPEGDFDDLIGVQADGTWQLKVCDDAYFNSGTLDSWEITFNKKTTIPIELSKFEGIVHNNSNEIIWTTNTESNSDFYIVERSVDLDDWIKLDEIKAAGTSKRVLNYSLIDYSPLNKSYYRLKMVDNDGRIKYSKTIVILSNNNGEVSLKIYPNPNNGNFNIEYISEKQNNLKMYIVDKYGSKVFSDNSEININDNILNIHLNNNNLESGIYSVIINQDGNLTSKRLIIQK